MTSFLIHQVKTSDEARLVLLNRVGFVISVEPNYVIIVVDSKMYRIPMAWGEESCGT